MTNKKKQVPCLAIPKVSLNWRNVTICITVSAAYFYCQQRGGKWNESTRKVLKSHSGSLSSVQALFSSQVIIWSRRQIDVVKRFANRYCEGGTNTRATPPPDTSIMGGQPWLPKLRSCGHFATNLQSSGVKIIHNTHANLDLFFLRIFQFCWFRKEWFDEQKKIFF